MFGDFGAIMKLMGNPGKLKEELGKFQDQTAKITAEGTAGGGIVGVKVNGRLEVVGVTLADEALQDKELLEDLIAAAANQAVGKVREQVAAETAKMAAGLGLPPGIIGMIPGLG